tara:strand:- start:6139 stop:6693 length:555 start_codon:yes stop_codon:yes gene_type:complete
MFHLVVQEDAPVAVVTDDERVVLLRDTSHHVVDLLHEVVSLHHHLLPQTMVLRLLHLLPQTLAMTTLLHLHHPVVAETADLHFLGTKGQASTPKDLEAFWTVAGRKHQGDALHLLLDHVADSHVRSTVRRWEVSSVVISIASIDARKISRVVFDVSQRAGVSSAQGVPHVFVCDRLRTQNSRAV